MHTHIQTLLISEMSKALESLQRRGIGYIDEELPSEIYYKIDDVLYHITITEGDEARWLLLVWIVYIGAATSGWTKPSMPMLNQ